MEVTTRELCDRAAAAADMHDNFVTPAQWMFWASQENLALALFLARSGWTQFVKTQTITVTGSEAGVFPLTETPLAIVAVHQVKDGRYRAVTLTNVVDFSEDNNSTGEPIEFKVGFNMDEDRHELSFYPRPTPGIVLRVSYVPEPKRLTLSDNTVTHVNTVSYPMGWEERIVLGMARRAAAKEESDTSEFVRQMRETEQTIEEAVWNRLIAESPQVRNADYDRRGWTSRVVLPSAAQWWFI